MEGDDHREAYTTIMRGGLLSRESYNVAEAEAVEYAEGNMCSTARRGAVALPWSKTPSRIKGNRRNLGDLVSGRAAHAAPVRDGKAMSRSR
jgi:uncharacterized protein (DUF3084 family)